MKIGIAVIVLVLGLTFAGTLVLLSNETPSESTTERTQVPNDKNNGDASSGTSLFGFIAIEPVISLDTCLLLLAAILAFIFARKARSKTTPEFTSEDVSKSENESKVNNSIEAVKRNPNAHHIDWAIVDAYALQRSGDIAGAIEKWDSIANVLEYNDKNLAAQALVSVGYLYVTEGKEADGLSALDKAIALKPDLAEAYNNRGMAKNALGKYQDALADFDMATQLKSNYAEFHSNRGMAKNALGKHYDALADFDVAILLKSNYEEAYNNRGMAKNALGEHQDALADFDEAIRLKPDYIEAYIGRGSVKSLTGQGEAAINDYTEAIRLKPDYAEAYYDRGSLKRKYEQYTEAFADFDEAIRLKPDFAEAYNSRGALKIQYQLNQGYTRGIDGLELLKTQHQDESILADFDEAIRLKPDFAEAYVDRGNTKRLLGKKREALSDYNKAIQIKPDYALAYANRGILKNDLGHVNEAKTDCETALELADEHEIEALKPWLLTQQS